MKYQNVGFHQQVSNATGIREKIRIATSSILAASIIILVLSSFALAEGGGRYLTQKAWSFGVHGDTQWTIAENDANPDFIAGSILTQVNKELIDHGVKLVFALGDMSDRAKPGAMAARAEYSKTLYDTGIGFFPMRGNHETYGWFFNYAPVEAEISAMLENFPQTRKEMFGVYNLSSPKRLDGKDNNELAGLSYSFDYGPEDSNVRFVILDTEDVKCETTEMTRNGITNPYWPKECKNYPIPSQQEWITDRLNRTGRHTTHAIVLSHRAPMSENHTDSPFNPNTLPGQTPYGMDRNPEGQNIFFECMENNGVKLYLGAHDHIHNRSIVKSPDGKSQLQEVIAAGLSTKFYNPAPIPYPQKDREGNTTIEDMWYGQKKREMPVSQEINNIGYYIYTVDGPRMTADYYSDARGNFESNSNFPYGADNPVYPSGITPALKFIKKETFGYSLNGREFLVAQGDSYAVVEDSFGKTTARILNGYNNSNAMDANKRKLVKAVETGWVKNPVPDKLKSDILSLWGMAELDSAGRTDAYVLSMSSQYMKNFSSKENGALFIATFVDGKWVNAVDENFGGAENFVSGKYKPEYALGTYGYDRKNKSVWAVLNYNADFVLATEKEKGLSENSIVSRFVPEN